MQPDFGLEWSKVQAQVFGYCLGRIRDHARAMDVTQEVALRAMRGYASFRGESTFKTWVFQIVNNELYREGTRWAQAVNRYAEISENTKQTNIHFEDTKIELVERGCALGLISDTEKQIIHLWNSSDNPNWSEVSSQVGISSSNAAVIYFRALRKLLVAAMVACQDLLGGKSRIIEAFEQAIADEKLGPKEKEFFESVVIRGERSAGRLSNPHFREACSKVYGVLKGEQDAKH